MMEKEPLPPKPVLVVLAPSITYWFSRPDPPEMEGLLAPVPPPSTTPGAMEAIDVKDRPRGMVLNSSELKDVPLVTVVVSSAWVVATTSTIAPAALVMVTRTGVRVLMEAMAVSFVAVSKPAAVTVRWYWPGMRADALKAPLASVTRTIWPRPPSRTTFAPAISAPLGPVTVPEMAPVVASWAHSITPPRAMMAVRRPMEGMVPCIQPPKGSGPCKAGPGGGYGPFTRSRIHRARLGAHS